MQNVLKAGSLREAVMQKEKGMVSQQKKKKKKSEAISSFF